MILAKDLQKQEFDPQTMGAVEGWGQKNVSSQASSDHLPSGELAAGKQGPPPLLSIDTLRGGLCCMNQCFTTIQIAFLLYLRDKKNKPSSIVIRLLFSKLESSFLGLILWSVFLGTFLVSLLLSF